MYMSFVILTDIYQISIRYLTYIWIKCVVDGFISGSSTDISHMSPIYLVYVWYISGICGAFGGRSFDALGRRGLRVAGEERETAEEGRSGVGA